MTAVRKGVYNHAHIYRGRRVGRASRLSSKLGHAITLEKLERLLARAHQLVVRARERQG